MAHNPHAPQGPQGPQGTPGNPDPAGSTQMFRAFVDEEPPQAAVQQSSGPKVGVIAGVVLVVVVLAVVAWLAFA